MSIQRYESRDSDIYLKSLIFYRPCRNPSSPISRIQLFHYFANSFMHSTNFLACRFLLFPFIHFHVFISLSLLYSSIPILSFNHSFIQFHSNPCHVISCHFHSCHSLSPPLKGEQPPWSKFRHPRHANKKDNGTDLTSMHQTNWCRFNLSTEKKHQGG